MKGFFLLIIFLSLAWAENPSVDISGRITGVQIPNRSATVRKNEIASDYGPRKYGGGSDWHRGVDYITSYTDDPQKNGVELEAIYGGAVESVVLKENDIKFVVIRDSTFGRFSYVHLFKSFRYFGAHTEQQVDNATRIFLEDELSDTMYPTPGVKISAGWRGVGRAEACWDNNNRSVIVIFSDESRFVDKAIYAISGYEYDTAVTPSFYRVQSTYSAIKAGSYDANYGPYQYREKTGEFRGDKITSNGNELIVKNSVEWKDVIGTAGTSGKNWNFNVHLHLGYTTPNEYDVIIDHKTTKMKLVLNPLAKIAFPTDTPSLQWHQSFALANTGAYTRTVWNDSEPRQIYHQQSSRASERLLLQVDCDPMAAAAATTRGVDLNATYIFLADKKTHDEAIASGNIQSVLCKGNLLKYSSYGGRGALDDPKTYGKSFLYQIGAYAMGYTNADVLSSDTYANSDGIVSLNNEANDPGDSMGHELFVFNSWNSKIANGLFDANGKAIDARVNAETKYSDGEYYLIAKTKSIMHRDNFNDDDTINNPKRNSYHRDNFNNLGSQLISDSERRKIVIDNFAPYIAEVKVLKDSALIADQKWALEGTSLVLQNTMSLSTEPKFVNAQDGIVIEVYFSEYMRHADDNIPSVRFMKPLLPPETTPNIISTVNMSGARWVYDEANRRSKLTIPVNAGTIADNAYKGRAIIAISRQCVDLNGNQLDVDPSTIAYRITSGWKNYDSSKIFPRTTTDDEYHSFYVGDTSPPADTLFVKEITFRQRGVDVISFFMRYMGGESSMFYTVPVYENGSIQMRTKALTSGSFASLANAQKMRNDIIHCLAAIFTGEDIEVRMKLNLGVPQENKPRLVFYPVENGKYSAEGMSDAKKVEKVLESDWWDWKTTITSAEMESKDSDWNKRVPLSPVMRMFHCKFPDASKFDSDILSPTIKDAGEKFPYFLPIEIVKPMIHDIVITKPSEVIPRFQQTYNDNGKYEIVYPQSAKDKGKDKNKTAMQGGDLVLEVRILDLTPDLSKGLRVEIKDKNGAVVKSPIDIGLQENKGKWKWQRGTKRNYAINIWNENFTATTDGSFDGCTIRILDYENTVSGKKAAKIMQPKE